MFRTPDTFPLLLVPTLSTAVHKFTNVFQRIVIVLVLRSRLRNAFSAQDFEYEDEDRFAEDEYDSYVTVFTPMGT